MRGFDFAQLQGALAPIQYEPFTINTYPTGVKYRYVNMCVYNVHVKKSAKCGHMLLMYQEHMHIFNVDNETAYI